jgi:hypothetical protein
MLKANFNLEALRLWISRRYVDINPHISTCIILKNFMQGELLLKRRLECLSSEAIAQAVLTKEADVEWRRLRTLTTAWEIYTLEQHQRYLHMLLEDDSEKYASATSEPLSTSIEALSRCSVEELQERKDLCQVVYDTDTTSFAAGHDQLDLIEDIACARLDEPKDR